MTIEWKELDRTTIDQYLDLLGDLDAQNRLPVNKAPQLLNRLNDYPYYKIYGLFDAAQLIASYTLIILDNFGHGGKKIAIVENVVVAGAARGQGIGKKMMQDAMRRAAKQNCYKLMLASDIKRSGAHAFYEKLGFEQHGMSFRMEVKADD
ncbi:GNAT family N-acetyltransferase [Sporolactobacillus terrae]|uniref:GNAT family N-acetyltransferase n=1 Tax=Sporolactobacillus terrae TaxID=269673 RepID=UPI00048C8D7E|nr:GNAT family N-acetyltransferase [Sporolactobacillus terrae]